jgi:hypothetical protein
VRGRDHRLNPPTAIENRTGEDLVGPIGQARQPGHVLSAGQRRPDRLIDQSLRCQ